MGRLLPSILSVASIGLTFTACAQEQGPGQSVTASPPPQETAIGDSLLARVSQSVSVRYWVSNPDQAPPHLQKRFGELQQAVAQASPRAGAAPAGDAPTADLFNLDDVGLPQNEESVTVCRSDTDVVLGGTNDYRGLLDPLQNFTGWHLSTNGGEDVVNEGRLPPLTVEGILLPSGGDPVDVADGECNLFAGSLNYIPEDPVNNPNAVGVYKSDPATRRLGSPPQASMPSAATRTWSTARRQS